MSLNNSIVTQSIGIPYQQYVTSSAGHTLVSSSTYFNDTSDNIPRYKDASGNIYDAIISSSYALTASQAVSASYVNIESLPLVNPITKYYNVTEITSSGTIVPLPDSLSYVSSSIYEYLEVYINGLRLRYNIDFIPASNTSIQYLISIPSGSELTYKSLKRP